MLGFGPRFEGCKGKGESSFPAGLQAAGTAGPRTNAVTHLNLGSLLLGVAMSLFHFWLLNGADPTLLIQVRRDLPVRCVHVWFSRWSRRHVSAAASLTFLLAKRFRPFQTRRAPVLVLFTIAQLFILRERGNCQLSFNTTNRYVQSTYRDSKRILFHRVPRTRRRMAEFPLSATF